MKSKFLTIGGLSALSVTIIANFGFADVSSERLDTYKANKLIPNEVQIATINSVSTDATGVAVFSPDALSWKSYSNASSAALGKYMDWTREDFEAFFKDSANEAEFEDAWKFLSQTGNDHLQGATISDEDALAVLQNQFNSLIPQFNFSASSSKFPAFPCEGISFEGLNLYDIDFSNCTGITGEQLASTYALTQCDFNPNEPLDFTGVDLTNSFFQAIDLSKASGLTSEQLLSMSDFTGCKLPSMDLTDADFTGRSLFGVDFSNCTGLTAQNILSAASLVNIKFPEIDFTGVDLSGKALRGADLSKCTNLTVEQVFSAADLYGAKLSIDFTGADLSGKSLSSVDLSKCNGLTSSQLISMSDFSGVTLPKVDFSGMPLDGFNGRNLYRVDFTDCIGLTGAQLSQASNMNQIRLTSEQYEAMKSDLPSGKFIYVDGNPTTIP